jgi:hypothetical protein
MSSGSGSEDGLEMLCGLDGSDFDDVEDDAVEEPARTEKSGAESEEEDDDMAFMLGLDGDDFDNIDMCEEEAEATDKGGSIAATVFRKCSSNRHISMGYSKHCAILRDEIDIMDEVLQSMSSSVRHKLYVHLKSMTPKASEEFVKKTIDQIEGIDCAKGSSAQMEARPPHAPKRDQPVTSAAESSTSSVEVAGGGEKPDDELTFDESYKVPFERNFDRFREKIGEEQCSSLQREGFVVIDNFLGDGWARALLQELQWLERNKLMKPNATRFSGKTFNKPHISETDLHEECLRNKLPELNELFWQTQELVGALETGLGVRPLHLKRGFGECTVKLQVRFGYSRHSRAGLVIYL